MLTLEIKDGQQATNKSQMLFDLFKAKGVRIILLENDKNAYFHAGDIAKTIRYEMSHVNRWQSRWNINCTSLEMLSQKNYEKINWIRTSKTAMFLHQNELKKILIKVSTSESVKIVDQLGIETNYKYIRKEIEICKNLEEFFDNAEIKYIKQHCIGKYRADIFLPEYNVVIEIDEDGHKHYDKTKENKRTTHSESHGYKILRINPDDPTFTLNKLFGQIMKYIMSIKKCE